MHSKNFLRTVWGYDIWLSDNIVSWSQNVLPQKIEVDQEIIKKENEWKMN